MTDVSFEHNQYSIRNHRPRDMNQRETVRVYNSMPHRVSLQIRYAKGYADAVLTIEQVDALIDTLIEARNETFPPIEPRKVGPVLTAPTL